MFRRLDSVSVFRWNELSWVRQADSGPRHKPIDLISISSHGEFFSLTQKFKFTLSFHVWMITPIHPTAKLVPTFADRVCRVVRATNLHGRNLCFLA
jgi:hypothetical protein